MDVVRLASMVTDQKVGFQIECLENYLDVNLYVKGFFFNELMLLGAIFRKTI